MIEINVKISIQQGFSLAFCCGKFTRTIICRGCINFEEVIESADQVNKNKIEDLLNKIQDHHPTNIQFTSVSLLFSIYKD